MWNADISMGPQQCRFHSVHLASVLMASLNEGGAGRFQAPRCHLISCVSVVYQLAICEYFSEWSINVWYPVQKTSWTPRYDTWSIRCPLSMSLGWARYMRSSQGSEFLNYNRRSRICGSRLCTTPFILNVSDDWKRPSIWLIITLKHTHE